MLVSKYSIIEALTLWIRQYFGTMDDLMLQEALFRIIPAPSEDYTSPFQKCEIESGSWILY